MLIIHNTQTRIAMFYIIVFSYVALYTLRVNVNHFSAVIQ